MSESVSTFLAFLNAEYQSWQVMATMLCAGIALGFFIYRLQKSAIVERAESVAEDMVEKANNSAELLMMDTKESAQELETELWSKEEKFLLSTEERIEELNELYSEKKKKADDQYSQVRQRTVEQENTVKAEEDRVHQIEQRLINKKKVNLEVANQYIEKLCQKTNMTREVARAELAHEIEVQIEKRAAIHAKKKEDDTREQVETRAKEILAGVLDRFARPYSAERGIPAVYFDNPEQRKILLDPEGNNLKTLVELTGCDMVVQDDLEFIGVAGFDPVRRELARRTLERILKERRPVNPDFIKKTFENQRKELTRNIVRDGDNLAKELRLERLHPEIRKMMGSLRYRYSFTQNQYFHCGEVGWLAGMIASELGGMTTKLGRRAGMLHDLGKSMDHELDGGHAVIGADFIEKRGEGPEVVHAVRSHHYDEQPATDLAFVVIAADAISGARPGARRSTMETYTQKVTELEAIARSHEGVTDCFVLSGGRELRVLVNNRKVDDMAALKMSKSIATKIEADVNYPGQIKVVVVRETISSETTKAH